MWIYNDKEFTSADIGNYIGFVYVITDLTNGMKYVGKKNFFSRRKLPPLKGKKQKRTKIIESDWETYYGSNEEVKSLVEGFGRDRFRREILHLCETKGELSYKELLEQVERKVLLKPHEYYNGIVQVRIHRNHVKSLHEDPIDKSV
jgi:hypothetical protein